MQPQAKKTPAVQPQAKKPQHCNHKRNKETSAGFKGPRGGQFVPWRAAETASSKPLKANQNHGKPWQDLSPKRKPVPPQMVLWGMHAKHGSPSRIQAQGVVTSSPDGLPKQHLENRLKAKQSHGKPWQDSSLKRKSKGSVGHACETGKPQQDSSPNLPKPSPVKLSNVAFWRPKETERWCNHKQRKPQQCNHKQRNPQHCNHKRNKETSAGFKSKGWSIRPLTGCRNSIFKTVKSKRHKNCLTSLSEKKMKLDHGKIERWNRTSLTPLARSPWSGGVGGLLHNVSKLAYQTLARSCK